jgi:hypothetical protein
MAGGKDEVRLAVLPPETPLLGLRGQAAPHFTRS